MIGLFAIILHYGTIIRYYCTYYCTCYCTYYGNGFLIYAIIAPIIRYYCLLVFLLFSIMAGCLPLENGNVHTAIPDPIMEEWLVSVDEECLLICIDWKARRQNGKLLYAAFRYYYTHCCFYYTHYLYWLNRIATPVSTSCALRLDAHPFCV
jgi:hypothetical protein